MILNLDRLINRSLFIHQI